MSSENCSIRVAGLAKRYEIYSQPSDRLRQMFLPKMQRWSGKPQRQYFHEFWALQGISFDVRRGETVGIVGRNGSGKSTLLQIICGTLTPTSGHVEAHGRVAALLELGSGFNPEFSGRENVYLNATVLGLSRDEIDARFDDIAAFADIGEFIEQPVKTYSSGMYVRLAFAVAINADPEILVVDEALSVGDEAFQRKCFARINKIRENGATILFVSHSAGMVTELCDRAILMDGGELLAQGTPKAIVSQYHKLLYADAGNFEKVRNKIRGYAEAQHDQPDSPSSTPMIAGPASQPGLPDGDEAFYSEGLVPKSTIRYEPMGATIGQPWIETVGGRQVNVLAPGKKYVYAYAVTFDVDACGVRFGMLIKNTTGLSLGGCVTAPDPTDGVAVKAGREYLVRFQFHTSLAPGTYFVNAGVTASEGEGERYLDRVMDAVMFRIAPDNGRVATGMMDLGVSSSFECCSPLQDA